MNVHSSVADAPGAATTVAPALPHLNGSSHHKALHDRRCRVVPLLLPSAQALPLTSRTFGDSAATVALSRTLSAALEYVGSAPDVLCHRELASLRYSFQTAWFHAAENLLLRGATRGSVEFLSRPAGKLCPELAADSLSARQVAVRGAVPSAWLAHPRTFSVLHHHFSQLLEGQARYLVPCRDILVAATELTPTLCAWAQRVWSESPRTSRISPDPVEYREGFPVALHPMR